MLTHQGLLFVLKEDFILRVCRATTLILAPPWSYTMFQTESSAENVGRPTSDFNLQVDGLTGVM
jgi:hypothetical protein